MATNLIRVMEKYSNDREKGLLKAFPVLQYFEYDHLPSSSLRYMSSLFYDLAWALAQELEGSPEKSVALRKLLEAKDAAVRSAL